jgi:antitoxin (DNA-binding transcriptional repressor) of toxin-antitoxin stability system
MKRLSVREMRAELTNLEQLLGREGEVLITRRGKAIARLLPVRSSKTMPSHAELRSSMPRLKTGSERLVRADRDER